MARGFVIYFSGRTGSTYLIKRLAEHPNIDARGEVFGAPKLYGTLDQTPDNQSEFLEKFYFPYSPGRPAHPKSRGFKIQIWVNQTPIADERRFVDVLRDKDIVHVHLVRRNAVKQLASSARAVRLQEQEGTPHLTAEMRDQAVAIPTLTMDVGSLRRRLGAIEATEERIAALVGRFSSTAKIYYEDLLADKPGFFAAFYEMVGVEPFEFTAEEELVKMTPEDLREVLSNFDEVAAELRGTRWETQLMEGIGS